MTTLALILLFAAPPDSSSAEEPSPPEVTPAAPEAAEAKAQPSDTVEPTAEATDQTAEEAVAPTEETEATKEAQPNEAVEPTDASDTPEGVDAGATSQPDAAGSSVVVEEISATEVVESDATETTTPTIKVESVTPVKSQKPYRDSAVVLRNSFNTIGLVQDAELTHNPYYGISLQLRPHWWFTDVFYVRGRFDLASELTEADWTTDTIYTSDLLVIGGADSIYTIPYVDVAVGGEVTLALPASQASRGQSLVVGTALDIGLSRSFPVLEGLIVEYGMGLAKDFHTYTTAAGGAALGSNCTLGLDARCAFANVGSGQRNVSWLWTNSLTASLRATEWLSAKAIFGLARGQLYGLHDSVEDDPRISRSIADPTNARYNTLSYLGVTFFPDAFLSTSVGALSFWFEQQRPDGSFRPPFLNRTTRINIDLSMNIDSVLQQF